jgi:argininosuccinate synthase
MTVKHVVGFSGGIDSQACARWVLNRYPAEDVILLNSDVGGHEHPITTEFIEAYSRDVHPVTVVTPIVADLGAKCKNDRRAKYAETDRLTFDVLAEIKGMFPSRKF